MAFHFQSREMAAKVGLGFSTSFDTSGLSASYNGTIDDLVKQMLQAAGIDPSSVNLPDFGALKSSALDMMSQELQKLMSSDLMSKASAAEQTAATALATILEQLANIKRAAGL